MENLNRNSWPQLIGRWYDRIGGWHPIVATRHIGTEYLPNVVYGYEGVTFTRLHGKDCQR